MQTPQDYINERESIQRIIADSLDRYPDKLVLIQMPMIEHFRLVRV